MIGTKKIIHIQFFTFCFNIWNLPLSIFYVLLTLRVDDNFRRRKNNPKEAKDIVFFIYSINIDNKNRKKK